MPLNSYQINCLKKIDEALHDAGCDAEAQYKQASVAYGNFHEYIRPFEEHLVLITEAQMMLKQLHTNIEEIKDLAYRQGWYAASDWAKRDDLISDVGSAAYLKEQERRLTNI